MRQAIGIFGDQVATELKRVSRDPAALDQSGWWAVTQTFEGEFIAFEFASVTHISEFNFGLVSAPKIDPSSWLPAMTQSEYENAVETIRQDIARGWVYQANLCYVMSAKLSEPLDPIGLWQLLSKHNPAPYLSALYIPKEESDLLEDVAIVSASPELFISRDGNLLTSSPIKGTAKAESDLLEKDRAENVMIVDLIRNDLSHVAISGTVEVPELLRVEPHPGLVHLVSDVQGLISSDTSWTQIFEAMSPPGSVSGAPKSSALEVINRLEKSPRQIYCGAFGFVDANLKYAKLAVGIRTFWQTQKDENRYINFGTGAGITWGSDPASEWAETQLKAQNLLRVASLEN
ncbi:MAG: hypothetical protein RLZZ571_328 [Actinomycetota bacterium]|jgi:para-aminobenzoate synthetase component 1